MDNLIIVQHCQSQHHINEVSGGWTDTPLTELGIKQAELTGEKLKTMVDESYKLFSSDLLRASQTAQIISKHIGLNITLDSGLRERNFGMATNKTKKWFDENISPLPNKGRLDHRPFNNAETWREFYNRIEKSLNEIEVKNAIIVSHGGALKNIVSWYLNIPLEILGEIIFKGSPGGITVLRSEKGFYVLDRLSDTKHLESLG